VAIGTASGATRRLTRFIGSGRLETHVEIVGRPKPRTKCCRIEFMWAQVVENQGVVIQQSLDVDELPWPVELLENALTKLEVSGSLLRSWLNMGDLIGGGQAQDFWPCALRQRMGIAAAFDSASIAVCAPSRATTRRLHHGEDFPELDPPLGLDHDKLPALEGRIAVESAGEPSRVTHHAVTDEISLLDHVRCLLPGVVATVSSWVSRYQKRSRGRKQARVTTEKTDHISLLVFTQLPPAPIICNGPTHGQATTSFTRSAGRSNEPSALHIQGLRS